MVSGQLNKKNSEKGMSLIEALVSTVIISIGFIAVFQMVSYSIQSIDVSNERTKTTYLTAMVAEDLIADKFADIIFYFFSFFCTFEAFSVLPKNHQKYLLQLALSLLAQEY